MHLMKKNIEYEKNIDFHRDMKLKNIIKFLILSATLSNTCLLATQKGAIRVGFYKNGNGKIVLGICARCHYEDNSYSYASDTYWIWNVVPVDADGTDADWGNFTPNLDRSPAPASKVKGNPEEAEGIWTGSMFYRCWCESIKGQKYPYYNPWGSWNDKDGFFLRCGHFYIRLDKKGILHVSGGEKGDILVLVRLKDPELGGEFKLPDIPIVFDNKESLEGCNKADFEKRGEKPLEGNTLIIEDCNKLGGSKNVRFSTFTNNGTILFDNIIWRGITVKNKGKIFARNLILDKSFLHNKGQIQWSDNFDFYREIKKPNIKSTIKRRESANLDKPIQWSNNFNLYREIKKTDNKSIIKEDENISINSDKPFFGSEQSSDSFGDPEGNVPLEDNVPPKDNVVPHNNGTVINKNTIKRRKSVNLDKLVFNNEGEIQWINNFDDPKGNVLPENNEVPEGNVVPPNNGTVINKGTIKRSGNTDLSYKIQAKCKDINGIGWLSFDEDGKTTEIKFPKDCDRVTVYVTGKYTGSLCSAIGFFETTDNLKKSDKKANEDTRPFSAIGSYHKPTKRPLYVALVDDKGNPCPAVDFDNSDAYFVFDCPEWRNDLNKSGWGFNTASVFMSQSFFDIDTSTTNK